MLINLFKYVSFQEVVLYTNYIIQTEQVVFMYLGICVCV